MLHKIILAALLVAGFVVNKFPGDARVLDPGLAMLRDLTGRPVLGVLPWTDGLWLDAEDSLDLGKGPAPAAGGVPGGVPGPVRGPRRALRGRLRGMAAPAPGRGGLPATRTR